MSGLSGFGLSGMGNPWAGIQWADADDARLDFGTETVQAISFVEWVSNRDKVESALGGIGSGQFNNAQANRDILFKGLNMLA